MEKTLIPYLSRLLYSKVTFFSCLELWSCRLAGPSESRHSYVYILEKVISLG